MGFRGSAREEPLGKGAARGPAPCPAAARRSRWLCACAFPLSFSLRELNLDRNGISAVPYLRQAESRHFFLHPALDDGTFRAEWYRSLSSLRQQPQHQGTEVPEELEGKKRQLEYFVSRNNGDPARRGEQCTPLPALAEAVLVAEGSAEAWLFQVGAS